MIWDTSCVDWEKRLLAGQSLVPDLPLFEEEASRGLRVFRRLRLPDVIGMPRLGEVGGRWFEDIVEAVFGSYSVEEKKRFIQEFFLLVPKKNSKSTSAAAIMLTAIIVNERPGAEFNFLAPTIEVAGNAFRAARGMVKADPELSKVFHIQDNIRRISHRGTDAFLQIKAADVDVVTGGKALGTLIDETHEFATRSRAADIFLEMRGSLAARPDGFLIQITTQSKAPPAGVFKAELERAREVRDGKLKLPKPILAVLYELPRHIVDSGAWKQETYWPIVNPNLRLSVDPEFLRSELIKAERAGVAELALLASQHFNIQIGQALRADRWAGSEHWQKQTDPGLTLDSLLDRCEIVIAGIDGGGLDDLFGMSLLGRTKDEKKDWLSWSHAWCHRGVLDRRQTIAQTLLDFEKRGELTICDDSLEDISSIVEIVEQVKERGILAAVAVDPAGIGEFVDALAAIQLTPENKKVLGAPQGYAMMNALKTVERKLANGTLWHTDCDLMKWAVSNIKIEPTATAIRATKQNAGDAKIDPAMALMNAATVMAQCPARSPEYQIIFA